MATWYEGSIDTDEHGNIIDERALQRYGKGGKYGDGDLSVGGGDPDTRTPHERERDELRKEREREAQRQARLLWEQRAQHSRLMREMQEQAKKGQEAANNAMAQSRARANAAANPDRSAFGGTPPTLLGGREKSDGSGSQLFSTASKLGGKGQLGGRRTLLGIT